MTSPPSAPPHAPTAAPARDPRGLVCVFAKPPRPGEAKTRLAATLGADTAARLAAAFLADTWAYLGTRPELRRVVASTTTDPADFDAGPHALHLAPEELWPQGDGDLGDRLQRVLARALEEAPYVVALGADCPAMPRSALPAVRAAFARPETGRGSGPGALIGLAADGGFYLLALRRLPGGLFAGLPWSAADTGASVHTRLFSRGLPTTCVEPSFDVDTEADLERLRAKLRAEPALAPRTATELAALDAAPPRA